MVELLEAGFERVFIVLHGPGGEDGAMRAFVNTCSHRGAQLVDEGNGEAKRFTCPYHAWTYGVDGRLVNRPEDAAFAGCPREAHGLTPLAAAERDQGRDLVRGVRMEEVGARHVGDRRARDPLRVGHPVRDVLRAEADAYVADMAIVAERLGVNHAPRTVSELRAEFREYQPELRGTPEAREAARFLLVDPPLPLVARGPYAVLGAAAVALLPTWARWPLRLPYLPVTERLVARPAGDALTRLIRWSLSPVA